MLDRPLRFGMVTTFYPPYHFGGDAIFVHRLSNELARRGHRVDVIHCREAYRLLARREPNQPYDDHPNVTVHGLDNPLGPLAPLLTHQTGFPLLAGRRLASILRAPFDVIHYHNVSLIGGPGVLRLGQAVKLYTMHEYWLVCPTHVLFRFNREPCERRTCLACTLVYRRPPQWWRYTGLLHAATAHVSAFIAPTRFCKDLHTRLGLRARIERIPYFLPAEAAPATSPEPSAAPPYFLIVARLEKLKGIQTVIPLFRGAAPGRLVIAGAGDYERPLRRLAADSARVEFRGRLSGSSLSALYRGAVALIVPSLAYEIMPQVVLEALAQGTPVVARNRGGMAELIADSGGGLTYDTDVELLAALRRLLSDRPWRNALGARGQAAARRLWTADAHLERYFALIHDLQRPSA
jgi:glycosyltransferase involved in cell wall biosynthesis